MKNRKAFLPIVILFIVLNGFFLGGRSFLEKWNADRDILIIGNLILCTITLLSFFFTQRSLSNSNPNVFMRAVYGGIMLKFFICIAAAFIYIAINKSQFNKPALFTCMGLYMVYTFMEVSILTKLLRQKTHG